MGNVWLDNKIFYMICLNKTESISSGDTSVRNECEKIILETKNKLFLKKLKKYQ